MIPNLKEIFGFFRGEGTFLAGETFGSGHIHDTFRITTAEKECDDYILQRLNKRVFRDIPRLQENVERVTAHQRMKLSMIPGSDIKRECLSLIPLKGSELTYFIDEDGEFWRLLIFISDHRSYERVDSPHKAYEGGKAVGRFQAMLADLPGDPLHETIPFFHNIEKRLDTFHQVLGKDPVNRAESARNEIAEIIRREEDMKIIVRLGEEGRIPVRITHNDTKFNNILFDSSDRALCLIDLDTVMPGYCHYDFGDAIRTASNKALEDENDISKVSMDISIFKSYAEGFLSQTRDTLNETEKEYLAFAPLLLTYTMATRFLTDFIDGDNYYKIKYPLHNLQRTLIQTELLKNMESQYSEMQLIIKNLSK
ncbi:MAG TPA: aminoglycoside phosphotransferase family protein [Bacteroidales bacterium]|nr:aminoglycoside phosphotransferase family protein [Bacteroidales bacterium]